MSLFLTIFVDDHLLFKLLCITGQQHTYSECAALHRTIQIAREHEQFMHASNGRLPLDWKDTKVESSASSSAGQPSMPAFICCTQGVNYARCYVTTKSRLIGLWPISGKFLVYTRVTSPSFARPLVFHSVWLLSISSVMSFSDSSRWELREFS